MMEHTVKAVGKAAGIQPSPEYSVRVNGTEVFTYTQVGMAGGSVAFASFDFTGRADVRVTSTWNVDSVEVRPNSRNIPVELQGNTAVFTITEAGQYFLKWNGLFELPVYLFANPPEDLPGIPEDTIRYFGPGIHEAGTIELHSNETLYLADGAFVKGNVIARNAENVKIKGRGILCGSHMPFGYMDDEITEFVGFKRCRDIEVDGVTLLDSFGWTLIAYDCDRVHINNVKIINERLYSTDGINPVNCRDVLIENCFIRCKDDCISIKGLSYEPRLFIDRTPIADITVRNCVFWSDNNNGIVIGSETWTESIRHIRFENIDILKTANTCGDIAGALAIISLHDTIIEDIVFQNINIEYAAGPVFVLLMPEVLFGNIYGWHEAEGSYMRNIRFHDISVTGGPHKRSYLSGRDVNRKIEDVEFRNLRFYGKAAKDEEEARIVCNEYTDSVRFC